MTHDDDPLPTWAFHDNLIYGLSFRPPEPDRDLWTSELVLDIDHIVEWVKTDTGAIHFRVAPATLTFSDASNLRIDVNFERSDFGGVIYELSIDRIDKMATEHEDGYRGPSLFAWRIGLNLPVGGEIALVSSGFSLDLRAEPKLTADQNWSASNRPPVR